MAAAAVRMKVETTFEDHTVKMKTYEDGSASLSTVGTEHFVYLYPEQVGVLKALLAGGIKCTTD